MSLPFHINRRGRGRKKSTGLHPTSRIGEKEDISNTCAVTLYPGGEKEIIGSWGKGEGGMAGTPYHGVISCSKKKKKKKGKGQRPLPRGQKKKKKKDCRQKGGASSLHREGGGKKRGREEPSCNRHESRAGERGGRNAGH